MKKYDVIIIGAGTAGLSARKEVAKKTDNYLVVDGGTLGTTCARVGCMPSKVLIQAANDFHRKNSFLEQGIHGGDNLTVNTVEVMKHVRKLRDRFVRGVLSGFESWSSDKLVKEYARFISPKTLKIGNEEVEFEKVIIATGSSPVIPKPWNEYKKFFIDTNDFFEFEEIPRKIAVIGLGVIGIELGQALSRLGVDVVGIGMDAIAGVSDPKVKEYTIKQFSEEMKIDMTGVKELKDLDGKLQITTSEGSYQVDKALVSVGRSPNLSRLDLSTVIGEYDRMPDFDHKTFQLTAAKNIFIAGDVNAISPILHESADEGAIVGYFAVNGVDDCFERRTPIGVTFCSPNIAYAGKKYADLVTSGYDFEVGEVSYEGQGRAIVMLKEKGILRVYGSKKNNKLLGAELIAPSGEHLAHLLSWAIAANMTVEQVLSLPFYHPVVEEGLRTALRDLVSKLSDTRGGLELARCSDLDINKS